jgi:hypothetical protein
MNFQIREKPRLKFKILFILFNAIITLFLLFVFVLPVFFLESDFVCVFGRSMWPLAVPLAGMLALALLGMDVFYLRNRRLFYLLGREDWPALVLYLEDRIIKRGHYASLTVRLLANTYLVLSDYRAVMNLENRTAIAKPGLVNDGSLIFGTARILGKDYAGAARFFEEKAGKAKKGTVAWARWYAGFALFLDRQFPQAADRFAAIAREEKDAVLTGLSSCFLAQSLTRMLPGRALELTAAALDGRNRVRAALPVQEAWNKATGKMRSEVYVAVLSKYLDETSEWLYIKEALT